MTRPEITDGNVVTFEMTGWARLLRPVHLLGIWNSADGFPQPGRHPSEFQDPAWDPSRRKAVAHFLDTGLMYRELMHRGACLMGCGQLLFDGRFFTDGHYAWTGALGHYVLNHQLRTPDLFTEHALRTCVLPVGVRNDLLHFCARLGIGLLVSDTWWLSVGGRAQCGHGRVE